ncbi:hypothetical protein JHK87_044606 [Glycine soja]|nr:hypothetical protein JHK87_044606 [Glycine soja]
MEHLSYESQSPYGDPDSPSSPHNPTENLLVIVVLREVAHMLRQLNSSHDETRNDYIASLCENTNPDHRYIAEILLTLGLLLRALSSELLTFQHHSSGHPINPELFLLLEQTKLGSLLLKDKSRFGKAAYMKLNTEKWQRKLIFDVVNEILGKILT